MVQLIQKQEIMWYINGTIDKNLRQEDYIMIKIGKLHLPVMEN